MPSEKRSLPCVKTTLTGLGEIAILSGAMVKATMPTTWRHARQWPTTSSPPSAPGPTTRPPRSSSKPTLQPHLELSMPDAEIETFNKFMVGVQGDQIVLMRPASQFSKADALLLAAHLVSLADPCDEKFHDVLRAVQNT